MCIRDSRLIVPQRRNGQAPALPIGGVAVVGPQAGIVVVGAVVDVLPAVVGQGLGHVHHVKALLLQIGDGPVSYTHLAVYKRQAKEGVVASLSRQVIFQLPLLLLFPMVWGLTGVLYVGPVSDVAAMLLCLFLVRKNLK